MKTVQLTLTLAPNEAIAILTMLENTSSTAHISPTQQKDPKEEVSSVVIPKDLLATVIVTPTAKKIVKMPSFGRTQVQVDEYAANQANRAEEQDEEALIKLQRKEDRDAKKAEKDQEASDKKVEKQKAADEVAAIKDIKEEVIVEKPKAIKPWVL